VAAHEPSTIALVVAGRIARADVAALCDRVRALLEESRAELLVCEVAATADPDMATVELLARLQLVARRLGRQVRLSRAPAGLVELLALLGLDEVLQSRNGSRLQPERQPEEREQPFRVEERGEIDDPAA
jgi:ABC-type transporter Mla MlaB component